MKREGLMYVIIILFIIMNLNFVFGEEAISSKTNNIKLTTIPGTFYKTINMTSDNDIQTARATRIALSSGINYINIIYPESGYYYVTDEMFLLLNTTNPSSCTYTFNGQTKNMISEGTEHYEYIEGLTDNMASEMPYIVDFSCYDGSDTKTAETYFWIKLDELNNYFIRSDIDVWKYLRSYLYWRGYDNGLTDTYDAIYSNDAGLHSLFEVTLFDSDRAITSYMDSVILNKSIWNSRVQVVNNQNIYFLDDFAVAWKNGNTLLFLMTYPYDNTTSVNIQVPLSLINAYIQKYPSDLRIGVCGDGKIDIFNDQGVKEVCDNNSQTQTCGSSVGECKQGYQIKKCKTDCTWGEFGACNDTKPKTETCDNKDNDCDGKNDEDFTLLGQTCYTGVGACRQEGTYICKTDKTNIVCNAVAKNATKENCNDEIDNDCDGKIDFNDTSDCIILKVNSPINGMNYSNKNILFDIYSDINHDNNDITISYVDAKDKNIVVKLCSGCNSYNKTKPIKDGIYNISVTIGNKSQIFSKKQIFFIVDTTNPKITLTLPKKGFTNGNFSIEFKEDNPKTLMLNYGNSKKNLDLSKCNIEKEIVSCNTKVNLSSLDNKEIEYFFNLTDITGKSVLSKTINLTVDTTFPKVKINWTNNLGRIKFIINITETNFDEISYIDSSELKPKEKTLCSRLKNNQCLATKSFKTGNHNLTIYTKDLAGNSIQNKIDFVV